jgi:hypothetical protein
MILSRCKSIMIIGSAIISAVLISASPAYATSVKTSRIHQASPTSPGQSSRIRFEPTSSIPSARPVYRPSAIHPLGTQPDFDFCNTTGGNTLACYSSGIEFTSSISFVLKNIALEDKYCDDRAVYATVTDNNGLWRAGAIDGVPYTFENGGGCGKTATWDIKSFSSPSSTIGQVYIQLFAANSTSHSDIVNSTKRTNPFAQVIGQAPTSETSHQRMQTVRN